MKTSLIKHAETIIKIKNNGLDAQLIKLFPLNEIINCCKRIEDINILKDDYKENEIFQKELVRDENFILYLNEVYKKELNIDGFVKLIEDIQKHNDMISNYPIKNVLDILNNSQLSCQAYYSYLKYFLNYTDSSEFKRIITNNLNHFYEQSDITFEILTEKERELLKSNILDNYNLVPIKNIKEIYEILVNNEELRKFILFLNDKKLYLPLNLDLYEMIAKNAKEIRILIEKIVNKVNDEIVYKLLLKWLENDCKLYDLKVLESKIGDIDIEKIKDIASNKSKYINFIYGNKLKQFPLELMQDGMEELIIYAISNNKNGFLRLIENNINDFLSIPSNSILYDKNFYINYINLNSLTNKHLNELKTMIIDRDCNINILENQVYTFEEIKTLYKVNKNYIYLYNNLLDLKIDERLLRIRQFIKKDLLKESIEDWQIENLTKLIKIKPLYMWLEQDFNKIKDIKIEDVVQILINYDCIQKFIPEIMNQNVLLYILRNIDKVSNYDNVKYIINNIEDIDVYWKYLKKEMNFSEEFIQKYKENINEFLLNNGAELAYKYFKDRNIEQKESFKLIVKSELMGEFKKLKYHTNDLNREIDYKLKDIQIKEWTENNIKITDGEYEVSEYDDFYHTMVLGECPQRTCLSYINGMYNKCLLACFDSNKKILYATINGKIVARAMVRLTKGIFNSEINTKSGLKFVDLEDNAKVEDTNECLTLFLEKAYIAYITNEEIKKIKRLFIELLKEKAKKMNAILVLSYDYDEVAKEQFILTRFNMYISKSKSSSQYLDSLGGQATILEEGQYKSNKFLIWKPYS